MSLLEPLRRLSRRLLAIGAATGLLLGSALGGVLLLAGVWLDVLWELPPVVRIIDAVLAMATPFAGAAISALLAWRRGHPLVLAKRIDRAAGASGEIRAAIDLELRPTRTDSLSLGLAGLAVESASARLEKLPAGRAVSARPMGRAAAALIGIGLFIAALAFAAPRLFDAEWLRWVDPFGDHPPFSRYQFRIEPGDARIIYGASIDLRARVEGGAIEKLDLMWMPDDAPKPVAVPMFPEGPGLWRATLTNVTAPGRYWARAASGRSIRHRIDVLTIPEIQAAEFRVEYPSYANRPIYEGPLPSGGLVGLPGTTVTLRLVSNRPIANGFVQLDEGGAPLTPVKHGGYEVSGQFLLTRAGKVRWSVTDVEGQRSAEGSTTAALVTDEAPRVRMLEPPALSFATVSAVLPVRLVAEDDFGLARVGVYRSLNDSRPLGSFEKLPARGPTRWSASSRLPLSAYGLAVGDEIKIHGRAEDSLPGRPNSAESPVAVVKIISQEDFDRMAQVRQSLEMLQSKYRAAQRRLEGLKEELDKLRKKRKDPLDDKSREALARELDALAKQMREAADALQKQSQQKLNYDLDEELRKHLESSARQLRRLGDRCLDMAKSKAPPAELFEELDQLMRDLETLRDELDRETMLPIETLTAIKPFIDQASWIELAHRRQKALVAKLDKLREAKSKEPPRGSLAESAEYQEQTRVMLAKALDELDDLAANLDAKELDLEDFVKEVKEFVGKWRRAGVIETMAQAEKELAVPDLERGSATARRALELIEELLKDKAPESLSNGALQGHGSGGRPRFAPGLGQAMGRTLAKMLGEQGRGAGASGDASRQPLDQIGLFGSLTNSPESPLSSTGSQTNARSKSSTGRDKKSDASSALPDGGNPGIAAPTGAADAAIPLAYRRLVAEYLRRIAEEADPRSP